MEVNAKDTTTTIRYIENCAHGNEEGDVINLSPHFVLDSEHTNADLSFPWMEQAEYIREYSGIEFPQRSEGPERVIVMVDGYEQLGGIVNITEMWKIIRRGWSLASNQQYKLAEQVLSGYAQFGYDGTFKVENILYDFCIRLLIPKKVVLFESGLNCIKHVTESNRDELIRFRGFYKENMKEDHLDRYLEIFSEYFRDYAEYDQTILYVKNLAPVPDGCVATSSGFKNTKMFYGNAFEHYTTNISILACLNNIIEGRPFDEFKKMNLKTYLSLNKANRGNPFAENPELNGFLDCIDSTLRNASHHGAMKLVKHRRFVEYRSGGIGAMQEMSYSKYLEKCSEIALSSAALLMLELALAS